MGTALATSRKSANSAGENVGTLIARFGHIAEIVRKIFPDDTVKTIARFTGLSVGAAHKKAYAQREFTADELAALLRTERGYDLLTAIIADAKPKWWRLVSASMDVREAQRLQTEARSRIRRAIRGALDADADLSAAIARAEAFSDADFHRPHADALRSMGGVSHSAVASPAKSGSRR